MAGHREGKRVHNEPALAGHGAHAVRDAIALSITTLPEQLRRSLTWDQGAEIAQHAQLRIDTDLEVEPFRVFRRLCPAAYGKTAGSTRPTATDRQTVKNTE